MYNAHRTDCEYRTAFLTLNNEIRANRTADIYSSVENRYPSAIMNFLLINSIEIIQSPNRNR